MKMASENSVTRVLSERLSENREVMLPPYPNFAGAVKHVYFLLFGVVRLKWHLKEHLQATG